LRRRRSNARLGSFSRFVPHAIMLECQYNERVGPDGRAQNKGLKARQGESVSGTEGAGDRALWLQPQCAMHVGT
jgi:hypothetical protein